MIHYKKCTEEETVEPRFAKSSKCGQILMEFDDPETDRKCCKNEVFMARYSVNTVGFRSVIDRIIGRINTHRKWS